MGKEGVLLTVPSCPEQEPPDTWAQSRERSRWGYSSSPLFHGGCSAWHTDGA